jgi:epoxyqueuosine reductase
VAVNASIKRDLIAYARSLGFDRVGIAPAVSLDREGDFLKEWLAEGRAGEMIYLERQPERRSRPAELLPNASSVVTLATNYHNTSWGTVLTDPNECRISRYAWGSDYHRVLGKRLEAFVRYMKALAPEAESRMFVDTGPLLERALSQRAGLGFIGKNTMLITKGLGSWVFLANVITTLELPADLPDERSCGECRLCIDACPTQAFTKPYELDPRLCISYLTIESEQPIPENLRPKMGGWVFGCDVCQEVCPHNIGVRRQRFEDAPHNFESLTSDTYLSDTYLSEILAITSEEEFVKRFSGTALLRSGREGLLRNACVAAANLGRTDLTPRLQELARNDSSPIVREHAAWAQERLASERA